MKKKNLPEENLAKSIQQLNESLKWLKRSYELCENIHGKQNYTESDYDNLENLTSRFSRTIDLLVNKLYRSIDHFELEEPGTVIDVVNRAEKRGLTESADLLKELKNLRNEIAHEYVVNNLENLFKDTYKLTSVLINLALKAIAYAENRLSD